MSRMSVATMFETPLLIDPIPDSATLNAELAETIRRRREQDPAGMARSNRFAWHSDLSIHQWGGPPYRTLLDRILAHANAGSVDLRQPEKPRYRWNWHGWANVYGRGGSNQYHVHPGAFWSAVYYVDDGYGGSADAGLGGEMEIEDPRMPMVIMEEPDLRFRPGPNWPVPLHEQFIRPATGTLLMFPGWLRHGVRPYQGDGERISIVINLQVARIAP